MFQGENWINVPSYSASFFGLQVLAGLSYNRIGVVVIIGSQDGNEMKAAHGNLIMTIINNQSASNFITRLFCGRDRDGKGKLLEQEQVCY